MFIALRVGRNNQSINQSVKMINFVIYCHMYTVYIYITLCNRAGLDCMLIFDEQRMMELVQLVTMVWKLLLQVTSMSKTMTS